MERVISSTQMPGRLPIVFDLVTTARLWPRWHPATISVTGVTERPYQLGDVVQEFVKIHGVSVQLFWTVIEHVRPSRIVLKSDSPPVSISYSFDEQAELVQFTREMNYDSDISVSVLGTDIETVRRIVQSQSDEAVDRLRQLIEEIVREENAALQRLAASG